MSNIIVAGGAGFIGSNLTIELLKKGHEVTVLDNFSMGRPAGPTNTLAKDRMRALKETFKDKLHIRNHNIIEPYHPTSNVHEIYNLASPASPKWYKKDPIYTQDTNYIGTKNMLGMALKYDAKFLQASTSEYYGDPSEEYLPLEESYNGNVNALGERACYDEGKRSAETLVMNYNRYHGVDTRIVRIFNTYGPNMHPKDGRVITEFINRAIRDEPLVVNGGDQTRSFCYVDDLVQGLQRAMDRGIRVPINLGNPKEVHTVNQLAKLIIGVTASKSTIKNIENPDKDDPGRREFTGMKAKRALNWQATTSLYEGLEKTIEYYHQVLSDTGKPRKSPLRVNR